MSKYGFQPRGASSAQLEQIAQQANNIQSQISSGQQQLTALTPLNQIRTVTDSYDGMPEVEGSGATANQVVVNGDFSNGTTGWTTSNTTGFSVTGGVAKFTPTAQFGGIRVGSSIAGVKYFTFARIKVPVSRNEVRLLIRNGGSVLVPNTNTFQDISVIATPNASSNSIAFAVEDFGTGTLGEIEVDYIGAIPITGTPFENLTADEINARIGTYWGGLKSAQTFEVGSRDAQLFDKATRTLNVTLNASGAEVTNTTDFTSKFIKVKSSTTYFLSGKTVAKFYALYNRNKNFISATSNTNGQVVTTASTVYVKISALESNVDLVMFGQSATALPYEPYQGSTAKLTCTDPTKFDMAQLPSLTRNTVEFKKGRWQAVKRIARKVLVSGDVTALTVGTSIDSVTISRATLTGVVAQATGLTPNPSRLIIPNFRPSTTVTTAIVDNVSEIGTYIDTSSFGASIRLVVAKGTYANLVAAQTALAGTVIYYELATPITIDQDDFSDYGIEVNGALSSNSNYTEFFVDNYDILGNINLWYATNIGKAMTQFKEGLIDLEAFQLQQNLINLEFDARLLAGGH